MWYVYIIECSNRKLYTGMTNNLQRRFREHRFKKVSSTSYNVPTKILYQELYPTKEEAAKREKQLKGWTRKKKLALIKGDLLLLKRL
jgi:predicted GIY-YIG superfamily endonuclease